LSSSMNTQNDKAYFDPIFLQMVEQGGIAAMLHECSGKSDRTCAAHPTTAGLLQQRAHSLGGIDRFLWELATEGEIVSQGSENCHMLRLVGISQSNRADALSSRHQIREAANSNEMNMAKRTRSNSKSVVKQSRARRDAIVIRAVCARPSYSTTPNEPQSSHCSLRVRRWLRSSRYAALRATATSMRRPSTVAAAVGGVA
jgi:hypothetical protein